LKFGVNLKKKMGGSAPTNGCVAASSYIADGICGASLRAGPGRVRTPNQFWCILLERTGHFINYVNDPFFRHYYYNKCSKLTVRATVIALKLQISYCQDSW